MKQIFHRRGALLALLCVVAWAGPGCRQPGTGAATGQPNAGKEGERFLGAKPRQNKLADPTLTITPPRPASTPTPGGQWLGNPQLSEKVRRALTPWADLLPLSWPVAGAHLSSRDNHLPGAPRAYRKGYHEGLDFYGRLYTGAPVDIGTPVYAVAEGVVIRVIRDYQEMSRPYHRNLLAQQNWRDLTAPLALDQLRGRQVWVRLGPVVAGKSRVARYCHLSSVDDRVYLGATVRRGQRLGAVGNSGTTNGVMGTRLDAHLHFELRYGNYDHGYLPQPAHMPVDTFVGEGLSFTESRQAMSLLFSNQPRVTP